MATLDVADALAGGSYLAPSPALTRTLLFAGATGRLGECILSRLLGSRDYARIHVLSTSSMPSTERRLATVEYGQWNFSVDDLVVSVAGDMPNESNQGIAAGPLRKRARTDVYVSVTSERVLELARRARGLGVKRMMLVTPIQILGQPSALRSQINSLLEADLHQLGFESLILIRPSDHAVRSRRRSGGHGLVGLLIETVSGLLVGARHTPMALDDVARASLIALQKGPGLAVYEADRLQELLRLSRQS